MVAKRPSRVPWQAVIYGCEQLEDIVSAVSVDDDLAP
jgi:hypothetical protein